MRKVIHVIRNIDDGGTERFLFNVIKNTTTDIEHIIVTYDVINNYKDVISKKNIKTYIIDGPNVSGIKKHIKSLEEIFNKEKPDVVHAYTHYNAGYVMLAAKKAKVRIRITHSHRSESTRINRLTTRIYNLVSKLLIFIFSNVKIACSKEAGQSLFIGKYTLIKNGIDLNQFIYNEKLRIDLRKKYDIPKDAIVIGTVGRLDLNKNQSFLIDIFNDYHKQNLNSKLIIIGEGSERVNLTNRINNLKLAKDVLLLGSLKNVNEYYNLFDIFALTSLKEGLPFVLIEAEANGLSGLVSDTVSKDANISNSLVYLPLSDKAKWLDNLRSIDINRKDYTNTIIKKGYSIESTVKEIEKIYLK